MNAKSRAMSGFIELSLRARDPKHFRILTPTATSERGCQLSILVDGGTAPAKKLFDTLLPKGIVCDFRHPGVVRAAPAPLYNTFQECWRLIEALTT
jgi:kynureninase